MISTIVDTPPPHVSRFDFPPSPHAQLALTAHAHTAALVCICRDIFKQSQ